MQRAPHFAKGDRLALDYTADREEVVWGMLFAFGDVIDVTLDRDVPLAELQQQMDGDGPWAWGAFSTPWVEDIASSVEACGRVVYSRDGLREERPPVRQANTAVGGTGAQGVTP